MTNERLIIKGKLYENGRNDSCTLWEWGYDGIRVWYGLCLGTQWKIDRILNLPRYNDGKVMKVSDIKAKH